MVYCYSQSKLERTRRAGYMYQVIEHPKSDYATINMLFIMPYLGRLTPEGYTIGAIDTIFMRRKWGSVLRMARKPTAWA